jgi:hypothetical protein
MPAWLEPFSEGLLALADAHGCELIGGDTTQGTSEHLHHRVRRSAGWHCPAPRPARPTQALLRSGAQAGDDIYVSGTLGDARLALQALQGRMQLPAEVLAQPASGWSNPHHAWRWAWRCAALPARRPTSATGCWATWVTSCTLGCGGNAGHLNCYNFNSFLLIYCKG